MKSRIIIILIIFLFSACRTYLNRLETRHQMRYFPQEYANIYLGMPLKNVKVVRPAMNPTGNSDSLFIEYYEAIGRDKIASTTYLFDQKDSNQLLNQIIIEFESIEETTKVARWLYGKPNAEDGQWLFDSKENFMIEVSKSGRKISIGKEKKT